MCLKTTRQYILYTKGLRFDLILLHSAAAVILLYLSARGELTSEYTYSVNWVRVRVRFGVGVKVGVRVMVGVRVWIRRALHCARLIQLGLWLGLHVGVRVNVMVRVRVRPLVRKRATIFIIVY